MNPADAKLLKSFGGGDIETNEFLRLMVAATPDCINVLDADGTLLFINQPGLGMIRANHLDEVLGRSIYPLVAPEDRDEFRRFNQQVCSGASGTLEFDIIGFTGQRCHLETRASPFPYLGGATVHLGITRDITDRRRADQASTLLSAIVDSSDDAIISKDLNGIVTSWNRSAERLFGYTASEAIGRPIASLIIPADRQDEEPDILGRLRRGQRVDHFETIRQRRDGALLHISLTISPVKDSKGRIIGASKIARDITERKAAEARIAQGQKTLFELVERAPFGIFIVNSHFQIEQMNRGSQEGAFRNVRPVLGRDFAEAIRIIWPEPLATEVIGAFRHTLATGEPYASSGFASSRNDAAIVESYEWELQRTTLPDGQFGVVCYYFDSTNLRNTEAALRASEARFRHLAEVGPHMIWLSGPDGKLEFVNQRWTEFSGLDYAATNDPGQLRQHLHPDDHTLQYWQESVASGKPFELEARLKSKEGEFRWFLMRSVPVKDDQGRLMGWFGASADIHENKLLQLELRRANQDLEQFAFSASHDLQEPLRSINIYSELLAERYGSKLDGDARLFLEYLRSGATRMQMLVRDLLTYIHIVKADEAVETTDAAQTLQTALSMLSEAIAESHARIEVNALPALPIHPWHMQQLWQNLIGNAIKYRSPERVPVVRIMAERKDDLWKFSVADNGIGIPPEFQDRIFGLFKRLHTHNEYSGTGIGLAICQRIVQRYRGEIWVESESGQGSTFFFTLPA